MDDGNNAQEFVWSIEEVDKTVQNVLDEKLRPLVYDENEVPHLVNYICEKIMEQLTLKKKPLKYIVSCMLMQRTSGTCYSSTACYWDASRDNFATFTWPKDQRLPKDKPTLGYMAMVSVYGLDIDHNSITGFASLNSN